MLVLHNDAASFSAVDGAYSFTVTERDSDTPRLEVWQRVPQADTVQVWDNTLGQSRRIAGQHNHGTAVRAFMARWDAGLSQA
jgi:hypothetical protein